MRYLLDTHIYLWWLANNKKLSESTKKAITDSNNTVCVSLVSFWEISIKVRTKKLQLKTSFSSLYENLQFVLLNITIEDVFKLHELPLHHKDPFDRILIAQAMAEKCTLITNDKKIKTYKIPTLG